MSQFERLAAAKTVKTSEYHDVALLHDRKNRELTAGEITSSWYLRIERSQNNLSHDAATRCPPVAGLIE